MHQMPYNLTLCPITEIYGLYIVLYHNSENTTNTSLAGKNANCLNVCFINNGNYLSKRNCFIVSTYQEVRVKQV